MDIQQAKAAKSELDLGIAELLNKFSADTGLAVEYISIQNLSKMGGTISYVVSTDVKLP
jgi:hypothetical protein